MDFIFDNIYILLIVAGGIASWIKNQRDAKEEREQEEHRRRAMAERAKQTSESESDFEFEEQNNPPKAQYPRQASAPAVPPPIPRSTTPTHTPAPSTTLAPRLRKAVTTPVEVPDFSAEIARQQNLLEQLKEVKKAKPERREAPARPTYSYSEKVKPVTTKGVISRLKSRSEIRQAIVLKEILDKPLGLR